MPCLRYTYTTILTLPHHEKGNQNKRSSLGACLWQSFVFLSAPTAWQILLMWHLCNSSSQEQGAHCATSAFLRVVVWFSSGILHTGVWRTSLIGKLFHRVTRTGGFDYLHTSPPDLTYPRSVFGGSGLLQSFATWQSIDNRLSSCKMHFINSTVSVMHLKLDGKKLPGDFQVLFGDFVKSVQWLSL